MEDSAKLTLPPPGKTDDLNRFAEEYASFNRIVNSLQRKYLELEEEFLLQNDKLSQANDQLAAANRNHLEASEFLNGILESTTAGVIAVDQAGLITHFNPAASLILGLPSSEPLGRPYRDTLPPGDPPHANALRAAETGLEVDSVEKKLELSDGSCVYLSVSTALLRNNASQAFGAVEVFQDLTRIKKMEHELARLNTLAALGEMAATVAHEVRNPLSGIAGFAALLDRDLDEDDQRRETVRKIIRGVETLNNTVTTLLDYARFKEINRNPLRYKEFLRNVVDQFETNNSERTERVRIEVRAWDDVSAGRIQLSVDSVLLRQVLTNLLENAVEAMACEGTIDIQVRVLPRSIALKSCAERMMLGNDETVVETVLSDSGPGIADDSLESVFAPFYSTRPGGNGLGLAVAWKIVKAHGGDIYADRAEGGGASFHLLLPIRIDNASMEQLR